MDVWIYGYIYIYKYGMMRAGTDQGEEEQWCRGLSQPPKEYITWIFYITRIHHMSQPPKDKDIGKEGIILELI